MAKSKNRVASLRFPRAGLNRRLTYQGQPPFTTPDALNVRPDNVYDYREGGGSRPGLNVAVRQSLGGQVDFLNAVTIITNVGRDVWRDAFAGASMGSPWNARGTWDSVPAALPSVSGGMAVGTSAATVGAVRNEFSPALDGVNDHEVAIRIVPDGGSHRGTYHIFMLLDASLDPFTGNGMVATLTLDADGAYSGSLKTYLGGVLKDTTAFGTGDDNAAYPGEFIVRVDSDRTVSVWWRQHLLVDAEDINASPAGQTGWVTGEGRWGFGMLAAASAGNCLVDAARCEYSRYSANEEGSQEPSRQAILIAGKGGDVYHNADGFHGALGALGGNLSIRTGTLHTAERLQKLYIADHGDVAVTAYQGAPTGATNQLDISGVSDHTDLGLNVYDFIVEITDGTDDIIDGMYQIADADGLDNANFIKLASAFTTSVAGTCTVNIQRGPKIFAPLNTGSLTLWTATTGMVPLGCELICMWRDRLVLATGHLWYMSRVGNPLDFNYGDNYEDVARAVAGNSPNNQAGLMGDIITALMPYADDCLLFGSRKSLWILRGDPAQSGYIDNLSYEIGLVAPTAWCYTPEKTLVFLSDDGLYLMSGKCGSLPESFSREKLPDELLHTNWANATVTMAYDVEARGIHLFITYDQDVASTHWWIDWEAKSLWKVALDNAHEPLALLPFRANDGTGSVLVAGRDGQVRHFQRDCWLDDGDNTITSYVMIGPLRLGAHDYFEGMVSEITGVLTEDSGDVDWSIHVGKTPEAAVGASAAASGTWTVAGLNYTENPRCGGVAAIVKLTGGEAVPWATEHVDIVVRQMGRRRVG